MASTKKIQSDMPRGDSRTLAVRVPLATYSTGASLFFALKTQVDNNLTDSTAVLRKQLTDANITSTDSQYVNYLMQLLPADTNLITPDVYIAEFEFVSADKNTVRTFPNPKKVAWTFEITGDINRRTA